MTLTPSRQEPPEPGQQRHYRRLGALRLQEDSYNRVLRDSWGGGGGSGGALRH